MEQKPSVLKPWMSLWGDDLPDVQVAECTVLEFIRNMNADNMNSPALNYFDRKITYRELLQNIQATAKAYYKLGVRPGDIVTLVSVMTPETIYSFYATSLLGATLNMADPRTSPSGIREYIKEVNSRVVLTLDVVYPKMQEAVRDTAVEKVIVSSPADSLSPGKKSAFRLANRDKNRYDSNVVMWKDFLASAEKDADLPERAYDPQHAPVIVHTGGTTGTPKGVLLGDKAFNALALQIARKRADRGEKILNIMPPFIAYGFGVGVHAPLGQSMEVILIPNFDPNKFGSLLNKYHPQHMAGVPLHYQLLANDPAMKHADLSYILSAAAGGDAITVAAEEEVNAFFKAHNAPYGLCKGYGMTEICACTTACIREVNKPGSVGIPMYMTTVGIFDPESGEELGFNRPGEVCVSGPTMMLGYYNMPDETANVIRTHADGTRWVHTGDIGTMDEDGYVFISNRIKRVIIRHDGFKVYPTTIENEICKVDGVDYACAVAVKDRDHKQGNLPYVFLTAKSDFAGTLEELAARVRAHCEMELAEYIHPVGYKFVEKLPYTGIGKVDYRALQEKAKDIEYRVSNIMKKEKRNERK